MGKNVTSHRVSSLDEEEFPQTERLIFVKECQITWVLQHIKMTPGPSTYAAAHAKDVTVFLLFLSTANKEIIIAMKEGFCRHNFNGCDF